MRAALASAFGLAAAQGVLDDAPSSYTSWAAPAAPPKDGMTFYTDPWLIYNLSEKPAAVTWWESLVFIAISLGFSISMAIRKRTLQLMPAASHREQWLHVGAASNLANTSILPSGVWRGYYMHADGQHDVG